MPGGLVGVGTGFFVDARHVLTNAHVVGRADHVQLEVAGRHLPGRVLHRDTDLDLALIGTRVDGEPLALAGQVAAGSMAFGTMGPAGAALGDLIGMGLGLVAGLAVTTWRFGAFVPAASLARGAGIAAVLAAAAFFWQAGGWMLIVKVAAMGLALLAALALTGEIRLRRGAPQAQGV